MSTETHRADDREPEPAPKGSDVTGDDPEEGGSDSAGRMLWFKRILAPVLALLTYFLLPADDPDLSNAARTTAAVAVLVAVWWMTEALPLPVTSLVPIVALPFLGVLEIEDATAPYANPTVFLFLGGFVIALAMQKWNLHRRVALLTMRAVGTKPNQLILGVMIATGFISMWVSNTATALMMLPIGISVLSLVIGKRTGVDPATATGPVSELATDKDTKNFATGLMLAIAYASTIGGLATLIGSPPNLIMKGFVEQNYDITISFADWMKLGVPLSVIFLLIGWFLLTRVIYPTKLTDVVGGKEVIQEEIDKLGPMTKGEWNVLAVFISAALLWVFREPLSNWSTITSVLPFMGNLSDEAVAIAAVVALFLIPVAASKGKMTMDWRTAQSGVPWGVLLLFGGGLSLAKGVQDTELSEWIGVKMAGLEALPIVLLVAAVGLIILGLTELTSNTATAATFLPVVGGVAVGIGMDPLLLVAPAALAATCSFMLPVGTPPNAIVFGSGYVTMGQMIKAGIWLNIVGLILITGAVMLLGPWALGLSY